MKTEVDKFTGVAGFCLKGGQSLSLNVALPWPEHLSMGDPGWTRRAFEGINVFKLMGMAEMKGYKSPFWLTLRDGESQGGKLKEGARGTEVALWRWSLKSSAWEGDIAARNVASIFDPPEPLDEAEKAVAMRPVVVFNSEEWECLKEVPNFEPRRVPTTQEALEKAEAVQMKGAGCEIRHEGTVPYYNPTLNYICVPPLNVVGAKAYYWMLFEQIGHALAGRHQMDIWGDPIEGGLSKEPGFRVLHAKMTAALLAYETGIDVLE